MKKIFTVIFFFITVLSAQQPAFDYSHEPREMYEKYFEQAAEEFGVPADLLKGISFSETRWTHMRWAADDTASSCTGLPRVYGVMGLWDNSYFGFSLREAAELIGKDVQVLKDDPQQNIRGGAALLRKYYDEQPKPKGILKTNILSWQNAVAKFSGFPQKDLAQERGLEVFSVLANGFEQDKISIKARLLDIQPIQKIVKEVQTEAIQERPLRGFPNSINSQPDYPLAKWNAAYSGNFGTQLIQQRFVVIHDVEGSYLGCISWFKNPDAQVSAHFVLNSNPYGANTSTHMPNGVPDAPVGEVTQMVEEKYRAWHAGCWNSYMIGIEHEGYAGVSGWYTTECYQSSSRLVGYLCDKYGIPKDRNHIIGHGEHGNTTWKNWVNSTNQGFDPTCNDHTDPGIYWDWNYYMGLLTAGDTVKPVIVSSFPNADKPVQTYKEISIQFNTSMDIASTEAAISITPNVTGTKQWTDNNRLFTLKPSSNLVWNTTYTVKVDTSAKNISKKKSLGTVPYQFTFTTVPLDTAGPQIVVVYPQNNDTNISLRADVVVTLNEPALTSSLSTTIKFTDQNNASVSLTGAKNDIIDEQSVISFSPPLKANQTYILKVLAGLKDYYNNSSKTNYQFQFTTTNEVVAAGTILDNFESNGKGWKQPLLSSGTAKIDSANSTFDIVNDKKFNGSYSGKLTYAFTDTAGGVIVIQPTGMPPLDNYSKWGMWVAGDAGNNSLQIRFQPDNQLIDFGKIIWRGWKYISLNLSSITGQYKKVDGIIIKQESGGAKNGFAYFDEMQLNADITSAPKEQAQLPAKFSLEQNYPNPFNPATMISYHLPVTGLVQLRIFDMLGREVQELVNGIQPPGNYSVQFDASELSSGMYIYQLKTEKFIESKKMLLLK